MNREETTRELLERYRNGEDTRNELIKLNMPLVRTMAQKYKPHQLELEDAVAEALIAFSNAIDNYDLDKKVKFSTFASQCMMNKMFQQASYFDRKKRTGIVVSLDSPVGDDDGGSSLIDFIPGTEDKHSLNFIAGDLIQDVLKRMNPRHQAIVKDYLKDSPTLVSLAGKYHLSRNGVFLAIQRFFKLIKQQAKRRGFREAEGVNSLLDWTAEDYEKLRDKWKTDTKICLEEKIDHADLKTWKKAHANELSDLPLPGPRMKKTTTTVNATVSAKISTQLKEAKAEIKRLKTLLDEQATIEHKVVGKTDAEYKEMKDRLLANISELTKQLEKAQAEAKATDELFEENERLRKENSDLISQIEKERSEKKDALIDAGKPVAENNDLKQQVEYLRQQHERETKYSDSLLNERNSTRTMLMRLEAFCMEKFKAEVAEEGRI